MENAKERINELLNKLGYLVEILRWNEDRVRYENIEPCEIEDDEMVDGESLNGAVVTVYLA